MPYEVHSTSPDGRYQVRVDTWEARNTLWIRLPEIYDLRAGAPLFRFRSDFWSLDHDEWETNSLVRFTLRKYPGNHLPKQLAALIDCTNGTARISSLPEVSLDSLEDHLERQLRWT